MVFDTTNEPTGACFLPSAVSRKPGASPPSHKLLAVGTAVVRGRSFLSSLATRHRSSIGPECPGGCQSPQDASFLLYAPCGLSSFLGPLCATRLKGTTLAGTARDVAACFQPPLTARTNVREDPCSEAEARHPEMPPKGRRRPGAHGKKQEAPLAGIGTQVPHIASVGAAKTAFRKAGAKNRASDSWLPLPRIRGAVQRTEGACALRAASRCGRLLRPLGRSAPRSNGRCCRTRPCPRNARRYPALLRCGAAGCTSPHGRCGTGRQS